MKPVWNLPGFTLDLRHLWDKTGGPNVESQKAGLMEELHRLLQEKFASEVGFYDWPIKVRESELVKIEHCSENLRKRFDGVACFGIGGSFLGAASVIGALRPPEDAFPLIWVSQVDPDSISQAHRKIVGRNIAPVVISKSGNTVETLAGFYHFSRELNLDGCIVVTDPNKGELRRLANQLAWQSFDVPSNIGGRFSVFTAVGLLPCALASIPIRALMDGARAMRDCLEHLSPSENPAYWLALSYKHWFDRGCNVQYWMPYHAQLRLLADWNIQLWSESLGKRKKVNAKEATGFTACAALGTSDQHSLLQLFKDGPRDKVIGFLDVCSDTNTLIQEPAFSIEEGKQVVGHSFEELTRLACVATETSLNRADVPTYRVILEPGAKALGALMFLDLVSCAFAGELFGVSAFDQPGVEEAKKLLRESMEK
ncbi:MAG: hypothetical protein HY537_14250 [Deltaproteobacteria bacterium]|nr:hypothetical protein [Deltaproteobacteria bacterium]